MVADLAFQARNMDNKGNIIAFDINPWQGPWMNRQQLLSRLAQRGWNIVYSKGQCTLWDRKDAPFKLYRFGLAMIWPMASPSMCLEKHLLHGQ